MAAADKSWDSGLSMTTAVKSLSPVSTAILRRNVPVRGLQSLPTRMVPRPLVSVYARFQRGPTPGFIVLEALPDRSLITIPCQHGVATLWQWRHRKCEANIQLGKILSHALPVTQILSPFACSTTLSITTRIETAVASHNVPSTLSVSNTLALGATFGTTVAQLVRDRGMRQENHHSGYDNVHRSPSRCALRWADLSFVSEIVMLVLSLIVDKLSSWMRLSSNALSTTGMRCSVV